MISAGIDAGSRTIKVVLWDVERREVLAAGVRDQGVEQDALAQQLFDELLDTHNLARKQVSAVVATGYGRKLIRHADQTITEITCQGRGVRHRATGARTIIDIGGQDSKIVRLDGRGIVADFVMNDSCAAGTGRFLEVVATRLGVRLVSLGDMARRSRDPAHISSMCVVFAETEIVGLLASGTAPEDIVAGVQGAIAARFAAMTGHQIDNPVVFTGGVALVPGMDRALSGALNTPVSVVPDPQTTAALGAAILAARDQKSRRADG